MIKKIVKLIAWLALLAGLYVASVLIYGTLTDYEPPEQQNLIITGEAKGKVGNSIQVMTWNIGFTGLGEETDFFYDGGTTVIQTPQIVKKNREGIRDFISAQQDVDVFLIQEIDSVAKRSYYVNQLEFLNETLPDYAYSFAINYNVDFIPMPLLEPMGGVISGLATFSRLPYKDPERIRFDSQFEWPRRVFFLDRCYLKMRIPLPNNQDLVVYNTHCSAYDTSGNMVLAEVKKMVQDAEMEYLNGNYALLGGDWNQSPPDYSPIDPDGPYNEHLLTNGQIPHDWRWIADPTIATNRKLTRKYKKGETYTTVIDHFLISPNLELVNIEGMNLDFKYSDHQPVLIEVRPIYESSPVDSLGQGPGSAPNTLKFISPD